VDTIAVPHHVGMREEFGLSGTESADLLGWALQCAVDEVRRTGRVGSIRDDPSD